MHTARAARGEDGAAPAGAAARGRHLGVLSAGSTLAAPIVCGRERERELGRQAGSLVARATHCQGLHGHGELEEGRGGTAGLRCTQKVTRPLRLLKMVRTMTTQCCGCCWCRLSFLATTEADGSMMLWSQRSRSTT